ncbi:MAG: anti-sigma factor [Bacteroidota bacterium]
MDIQAYISSGAIESYVLGLSSAAEMQELETLALEHAGLRQAITAFEEALEAQALANAVAPPPALKQQVMDALAREGMKSTDSRLIVVPTNTSESQQAKVVSLTAAPKGIKWLRGAIAASIILLLGSAILNFYFYGQYKKISGQYTELMTKNSSVMAKNEILQASYDMLKDTSMMRVQMNASSPATAGSVATVLWDKRTQDVYLMVNNLPQHDASKQYQLWAIVDGKPVDAGMLDINNKDGLLHMKNIKGNVQAFAITLEKKGGSPTPTMEQMYVVGNV